MMSPTAATVIGVPAGAVEATTGGGGTAGPGRGPGVAQANRPKARTMERNKEFMDIPFVLASGSPRRRALLARVRRQFSVTESGVPEPVPRGPVQARFYVLRSAARKARAVARRVPRGWVLGADTEVVRRGRVFGKPRNVADAARMLNALSGRWHQVHTGLALIHRPSNRLWTAAARTDVRIRDLSPADLARYSKTNHDKAGAYAAQARGNPFVEKHRGPYDNIVGLPLDALRALLRRAEKSLTARGRGTTSRPGR
jgi:septum formation protein